MKRKNNWIYVFLIFTVALSCKKPKENPIDDDAVIQGAVKVQHGETIGSVTKKTIGPDGGSITLPNSMFKLNIPAGAVDKEVEFSVQEVSNSLPYGGVSQNYRFLPEDVAFKKDVEITLPYKETSNMVPAFLRLGYQDKKGYWHVVKNAVLNRNNMTVTAKTQHFSDWGVISNTYIKINGKTELDKGESTELELKFIETLENNDLKIDVLLGREIKLDESTIKEWRFYGTWPNQVDDRGTISGGKSPNATYTAPTTYKFKGVTAPQIEAVILDPTSTTGERVVRVRVNTLSEEYCLWNTGEGFTGYNINSGNERESGVDVLRGESIFVNFESAQGNRLHIEAPDNKFGQKKFSDKVLITYYSGIYYFSSYYTNCGSSEDLFTTGDIVVIENKNGLVTGVFEGTLKRREIQPPYCWEKSQPFKGRFRYRIK